MLVQSRALQEAVSVISQVPSRSGIPSSEFLRLRNRKGKLYLALSSEVYGEVSCQTEGHESDWDFYVDRKLLTPFITASVDLHSEAPFKFIATDSRLTIKCSHRQVRFVAIDPLEGYSKAQKATGPELILTDRQRSVLYLASRYATRDPTAADLNCVYLLKDRAVMASTKYAVFFADEKRIPVSVPLPLQIMNLLSSPIASKILIGRNNVVVETAIGAVCQALNEKSKRFPRESVLKLVKQAEAYPFQFAMKVRVFVETATRLYQYVSGTVNRDIVIDVEGSLGNHFITLICKAPQGTFRERVRVKNVLKIDVACSWLADSILPLTEAASSIEDIKVCFDPKGITPYVLKAKGIRVLLTTRKR